ncbi:response regulator [Sphingomonas sp. BE138]|jgi:CheY-like chemotaxis protein|uniref:response regulator n=1 Tax=Sphingomonas sp. BE138 TaxID=2817845 RepID=UPI00286B3562|nr:response regulator [Sphingomonas sp. BE138]
MCHVLVIEDEPLIAEWVSDLASDGGATSIDIADTQAGAIASARQNPPALILSDVKLAEGTGPMACSVILEELGERPVIFITGTPEECQPCHYASAILGKPIVPHEVVGAFRRFAPV